jgi:hypothetical protein
MAGGVAILLFIIVLLVVGAIGLAAYGSGSLERWRDGDMERRR